MKVEEYLEENNYYWEMPSSYSWKVRDEFGNKIPKEKVIKEVGLCDIDIWSEMFHLTKRCYSDGLDDYNEL